MPVLPVSRRELDRSADNGRRRRSQIAERPSRAAAIAAARDRGGDGNDHGRHRCHRRLPAAGDCGNRGVPRTTSLRVTTTSSRSPVPLPDGSVSDELRDDGTQMRYKTFSDGCLGSHNDEERSELRYVLRLAESSESSKL